jgi:poly-gamma-glutamate system protein
MKKLYWRPQKVSSSAMALIAVLSAASVFAVEEFRVRERQPFFPEKFEAAQTARRAFEVIKEAKARRKIPLDKEIDPLESGMIGELNSEVTTNSGHLPAKITTLNPNFAAVVFEMLKELDVGEHDVVAVGMSGSFPAMNVHVMAALKAIKADPVFIASVGASQWGANQPKMMWPDMEKVLREKHVFTYTSSIATRGGIEDVGLGITPTGLKLMDRSIERAGLINMNPVSYMDSLERRMTIYRNFAGARPIKAYINVGGGTTSVGTEVGKRLLKPGINRSIPREAEAIDSVMVRFLTNDVPVIHITKIEDLAARYGLPVAPTIMPPDGEGKIFVKEVYNDKLAGGALAVILFLLLAFVRFDWGYLVMAREKKHSGSGRPAPMV